MRLDAGIRPEQAELTPGLAATLRRAASMHNPGILRTGADAHLHLNIPGFLHCYQETIDGGLILPRGMLDTATSLAAQAGSRLDITDHRSPGTAQDITCSAVLTPGGAGGRGSHGRARTTRAGTACRPPGGTLC